MWFGLFEATFHNKAISDAEKMTHLQTLTTGKANQAICGYSCNSTMYNAALHELRRQYGRPDIIINDFVNRLQSFKQPSTHRRDSYMEFSTFISNLVETFRTLGFKDDLNSTIYVQFAVSKLQHHQQLQWTQYITAQNIDQPNLIAFNDWIRQFTIACNHLPPMQPQQMTLDLNDRQQIAPRIRHANGSRPSSNQPSQKTSQNWSANTRPPCPFDGQTHHPAYCRMYQNSPLEENKRLVSVKKLCFNCLGQHQVKDCPSKHTCSKCNQHHHTTLHDEQRTQRTAKFNPNQRPNQVNHLASQKKISRINSSLLLLLPVTLRYRNIYLNVYAFLDTGSTNSYISQPTAAYLQLEETNHQEQLLIGGFFNSQTIEAKTVDITVHSFGNNTLAFELTNVLIKENINLNAAEPEKLNDICSQYDHLKDICFPDFSNNDVALVIGTDNIDIISPKTIIKGNQNVPRAVLTALGWTIAGPNNDIGYFSSHQATATPIQISTDDTQISDLLASFWRMKTYATSPEITMSSDERHAMKTLRKTISLYDNRYQLGLLWKPNANLPNNYKAAIAQYNRMKIQLNKNSEKLALYQNTIDQNLSKHYIWKLEPDEIPSTVWILPEHGVINPNKPGKLRRVSNAKSKFKGVCLNDMLLTRPDLICNLLGVITRFCVGKATHHCRHWRDVYAGFC